MDAIPPGPRSPALVQVIRWLRQPIPLLRECAARYGDVFTLRFPGFPPLVLFSAPDAIKEIFTGSADDLRAGEANVVIEPVVGRRSLLLLDGARHHRERRLLMPAFHGDRMRVYGDLMRAITDETVVRWPIGESLPILPEMQRITLEVILRAVFGIEEGPRLTTLRDKLSRMIEFGVANPRLGISWLQVDIGRLTAWGRFKALIRDIDALLLEEFARRRETPIEGGEDILTLLLAARDEHGEPMTDAELRDEMITLLLAGHETSATTLAWIMHRLLDDPAVLTRVRAELASVVGAGPFRPEHVNGLEYLEAVIKETLRLNPIIPAVARRLSRPMRLGAHDLPADVVAAPCIYLTHHRPDVWDEPERFAPERFLHRKPSPYEFLPFGGGLRHCLGAAFAMYEMKIVLATVLSRIELHAAPGYRVRVVRRGLTFAPSEGVPVVVDRRAA